MHLFPRYLIQWDKTKRLFEMITNNNKDLDKEDKSVDMPILRDLIREVGVITPECLQHMCS